MPRTGLYRRAPVSMMPRAARVQKNVNFAGTAIPRCHVSVLYYIIMRQFDLLCVRVRAVCFSNLSTHSTCTTSIPFFCEAKRPVNGAHFIPVNPVKECLTKDGPQLTRSGNCGKRKRRGHAHRRKEEHYLPYLTLVLT
jgi:hypothetical protein